MAAHAKAVSEHQDEVALQLLTALQQHAQAYATLHAAAVAEGLIAAPPAEPKAEGGQ